MAIGIAAYSCYLPAARLTAAAYRKAWRTAPVGWEQKAVADLDEDALTLALSAASQVDPGRVDYLALVSMTLPYRRKVQAGLLAEGLGLDGQQFISEHTTSRRAGTEALIAQWALLTLSGGGTGLTVAAEVPDSPAMEDAGAPLGAGAVALVLAEGGEAARLDGFQSTCSEDPGLLFTPAGETRVRDVSVPDYAISQYLRSVRKAALPLMARLGTNPADYRFLVLNPPDPRQARSAAKAIGFSDEQWQAAWPYPGSADVGAAQPFLGLVQALDAAQPGDRILLVGHGSGSACDAISLTAGHRAGRGVLRAALAGGREIDYITYLKLCQGV